MKRQLWAATRALLTLTVLLGIAYPLGLTALAELMPGRATGSLVLIDGRPAGSTLLGQAVVDPQWFRGRPSVSDYSGETSGGSNWGPSAAQLSAELAQRSADLREANPLAPPGPIPADALTASASGLDPHISPAYARWQAPRVAAARGMTVEQVQRLIEANTTFGELGFLGADRVNVTTLNVALADLGR
jgi:K+-transporting ATPase ATPase C chain